MNEVFNVYSHLSDQTKFRLNKMNTINNIKDYFNAKIHATKIMSKKLSKYIAAFDYFDKTLIALFATSGGRSIISFTNVIEVPVGMASPSFSLLFPLTTGIIKKLLEIRNKKKKHKIKFLC